MDAGWVQRACVLGAECTRIGCRVKPDLYYEKIAATCDSDGRFIPFCRKSSATSGKHT